MTRDEESFFSLNGRNDQDNRWTSLNDFDLYQFAGPWHINPDQIQSKKFLEDLEQNLPESIYLGGPCYVASQKTTSNIIEPYWLVLMYIEVELRNGEDYIELSPKQGVWNISPLVESLIDRLEISTPTSVTKLAALIMENAMGLRSSDMPLNLAVWRALEAEIPEVVQELRSWHKRRAFPVKPSPWVLFKPTTTFSALTQNLISDYNEPEKLLSDARPEQGGGAGGD